MSAVRLAEIKASIVRLDGEAYASVWLQGKLLKEARGLCAYGEWLPWLKDSFNFSKAYAARLINLYEAYPEGLPADLGISVLLCTITLDEVVRAELNEFAVAADLKASEVEILARKLKASEEERDKLRADIKRAKTGEKSAAEVSADLLAKIKAEAESKANEARAAELAELEAINRTLAGERDSALAASKTSEGAVAECARLKTALSKANEAILAERERAASANTAAEVAAVKQREAEARAAGVATKTRTIEKEVKVEVVPADYEQLKAQVDSLRAAAAESELLSVQLAALRRAAEARALKFEAILRERRLLRERVALLEALCSSAGLEFPGESVPVAEEFNLD